MSVSRHNPSLRTPTTFAIYESEHRLIASLRESNLESCLAILVYERVRMSLLVPYRFFCDDSVDSNQALVDSTGTRNADG